MQALKKCALPRRTMMYCVVCENTRTCSTSKKKRPTAQPIQFLRIKHLFCCRRIIDNILATQNICCRQMHLFKGPQLWQIRTSGGDQQLPKKLNTHRCIPMSFWRPTWGCFEHMVVSANRLLYVVTELRYINAAIQENDPA